MVPVLNWRQSEFLKRFLEPLPEVEVIDEANMPGIFGIKKGGLRYTLFTYIFCEGDNTDRLPLFEKDLFQLQFLALHFQVCCSFTDIPTE